MRFHLGLGSKVKRLFVPSPVKQQQNPDVGLDSKCQPVGFGFDFNTPRSGNKEETFFDSRPLFDSDCEDDFYSVNGEFTPSRGSTPNYQMITPVKPRLNTAAIFVDKFSDSKSEISPTTRKKLLDLLRETSRGEQADENGNIADVKVEMNMKPDVSDIKTSPHPKPLTGALYHSGDISVVSSELTPNREYRNKEKTHKAMGCCMPNLAQSFSFNARQKMPPVH